MKIIYLLYFVLILSCNENKKNDHKNIELNKNYGESRDFWNFDIYKPNETTIEGIPLHVFDLSWKKASVFSEDLLSLDAKEYIKALSNNYRFTITGDFNNDNMIDKAMVGIYSDKGGMSGNFLLIITNKNQKWIKSFLYTWGNKPKFAMLNLTNQKLWFGSCFECDAWRLVVWDGNNYTIKTYDYK